MAVIIVVSQHDFLPADVLATKIYTYIFLHRLSGSSLPHIHSCHSQVFVFGRDSHGQHPPSSSLLRVR